MMDENQIPFQQDFLYPVVDPSEPRETVLPVDQMSLYNSPFQYNRYNTPVGVMSSMIPPSMDSSSSRRDQQNASQAPHQSGTPQMQSYRTNQQWLQPVYPSNGVVLDLADLIPGQAYTADDSHSSISSTISADHSMYSRHTNKSSESSVTSSPEYSYHNHSKNNYTTGQGSASPPTFDSSSMKNDVDAEGKTKRSRMGCLTCRHRKKRCCETRPRCYECGRLGLKCSWPAPGSEHRNKPKHVRLNDDMHYDPIYGNIKILRGIVEHRVGAV